MLEFFYYLLLSFLFSSVQGGGQHGRLEFIYKNSSRARVRNNIDRLLKRPRLHLRNKKCANKHCLKSTTHPFLIRHAQTYPILDPAYFPSSPLIMTMSTDVMLQSASPRGTTGRNAC